jgi:hypothetical protein
VRPPLVKGLFVEVDLRGAPRPDSLVIPRQALHDGHVYVLGADDRLEVRPVELAQLQPEYAVIESGLEPGERVLVSDLFPAVAGMALAGQPDEGVLERLLASARAEDSGARSEE